MEYLRPYYIVFTRLNTLRLALVVGILVTFSTPQLGHAQSSGDARSFMSYMGYAIFKAAWPTAEYSRVTFGGVTSRSYGADIKARVYGVGALSGSTIWTDLVLSVGPDLSIIDLKWGNYDAWLPPGTMYEFAEDMLEALSEQNTYTTQNVYTPPKTSAQYDKIYFKNKCHETISTAIYYKDLSGTWKSGGWWNLEPGESAYVANTKNTIFYTYAVSKTYNWSGTDTYSKVRGSSDSYGFRQNKITTSSWGTWTQSFSCN